MKQGLLTIWDRLRSSYWFVPSLMALTAVVLAFVMVRLDEQFRDDALRKQGWIYSGGPEGARAVLSTIAGSIITVAGTTFSITIAALSLASAQFGPRLLRNFMRDTGNQVVLGTFTATYLYCLLVLRTVRGVDDNVYVPHISVTGGVVLAIVSLAVLIYFIHHIAESIQVGHIIHVVSGELHSTVDRIFPGGIAEPAAGETAHVHAEWQICAEHEGYIQAVSADALLEAAADAQAQLELFQKPGDYVLRGSVLAASSRSLSDEQCATVRRAFALGRERTPHQDATFAFLQLVEIALRALSPGVNDPFTAVMCIDRLISGMNRLATRALPPAVRRGPDGMIRVIAEPSSYSDLVSAAFSQIRQAAADHPHVLAHLRRGLEHLAAVPADPRFTAAIRNELHALRRTG